MNTTPPIPSPAKVRALLELDRLFERVQAGFLSRHPEYAGLDTPPATPPAPAGETDDSPERAA